MMRQYLALKREVPEGAILMFRLGDFYEMFAEDAVVAAPILGATLTKRNSVTMCGIPHHALNSYLAKRSSGGSEDGQGSCAPRNYARCHTWHSDGGWAS